MFKKIITVIAVLLIIGGVFATNAFAGPPFPAEPGKAWCTMPWLDSDYGLVWIEGNGTYVFNPHTGNWMLNCFYFIDFTGPYASIEDVCSLVPEYCNGNGTFILRNWECWFDSFVTYDSIYIVNPSGNATSSCQYHANKP